jgi:hypothetical protein
MIKHLFPPHAAAPEDKRGTHPTPASNAGGGGGAGSVTPDAIGGGDHPVPTITGLTDAGPDVRDRDFHVGGGGGGGVSNASVNRMPDIGGPWGETSAEETQTAPHEPDRESGRGLS